MSIDHSSASQANALALIVTATEQLAALDTTYGKNVDNGDENFTKRTMALKTPIEALSPPAPSVEIIIRFNRKGVLSGVYSTDADVKTFIANDEDFDCCLDRNGRRLGDCEKGEHTEGDIDKHLAVTARTLTMTEIY